MSHVQINEYKHTNRRERLFPGNTLQPFHDAELQVTLADGYSETVYTIGDFATAHIAAIISECPSVTRVECRRLNKRLRAEIR